MPTTDVAARIAGLRLVDHHVHSTWCGPVSSLQAEELVRESGRPLGVGLDAFDSPLGFAIRRHCAPLIGLPSHCSSADYLAGRAELTPAELTGVFLEATPVTQWLVDTGFRGDALFGLDDFQSLVTGKVHEIVRLETLLEDVSKTSTPTTLVDDFRDRLDEVSKTTAGWKSVVAYRHGLDVPATRPTMQMVHEVVSDSWGSEGLSRVDHPTLLSFLLWEAADTGKPLQLHTGFGDADLRLDTANPTLLTDWLRAVEGQSGPVILLHTYPYQRHAAYLAHVYPHVYFDVGLGMHFAAAGSPAILREALEIAPFGKILYSSDGWGLPEMHFLGAHFWTLALSEILQQRVDSDEWSVDDALRVAQLMCSHNARRIYGLD